MNEDLSFLARTQKVRSAAESLVSYTNRTASDSRDSLNVKSPQYRKLADSIHAFLADFMETHSPEATGYHDILIVAPEGGRVLYSFRQLSDLGEGVAETSLAETGLAKVWQRVVKTGKPALSDLGAYTPIGGQTGFYAVPVKTNKGEITAVLVLRFGREVVARMIRAAATGLGRKVYLVGRDHRMRADWRNEKARLGETVASPAVDMALRGEAGTTVTKNYLGRSVLCAYSPLYLKNDRMLGADFDWCIISEIGAWEAYRPLAGLGIRILIFIVIFAATTIPVTYFRSRTVARPIQSLAERAARISRGDLTVDIPSTERQDEVGALVEAYRIMVENLRQQTRQIREGVNVLAASAAEISATASQLTAAVSRTSAAVTETTATVGQVKQSSRTASDTARRVSEDAVRVVRTSDEGKLATENTIEAINLIKEQMISVSATVNGLLEKSKAIEEIILAVQDIADQSDLLAVNASIEAARAGEEGRGFGTVALEIKSLASQSKEATAKVRTILKDIRKSVAELAAATQQGQKTVDKGLEQSAHAGESIRALSSAIAKASKAAGVILSSSEQQSVGVDHVAEAMTNIDQAMRQYVDATSQLGSEAKRLEDLGASLKSLVEQYQV